MLSPVKSLGVLALCILLAGCLDELAMNDAQSQEGNSSQKEIQTGAWTGTIESRFDGEISEITFVTTKDAFYYIEERQRSGIATTAYSDFYTLGSINRSDGEVLVTMPILPNQETDSLNHFLKTPAYGKSENETIEISLSIEDDKLSGSYVIANDQMTLDRGDVFLFSKETDVVTQGAFSPTDGGGHQFVCGSDGQYPLYCYSYLSVNLSDDLSINGTYEDRFNYSTRPSGISQSIPSEHEIGGSASEIKSGIHSSDLSVGSQSYQGVIFSIDSRLQGAFFSEGGLTSILL